MKRPKVDPPGALNPLGLFGQKPREAPAQDGKLASLPGNTEETHVALVPEGEGEGEAGLLECPVCLLPQPSEAFPKLSSCTHLSCLTCLQQYLRIEIGESRVPVPCPHCPAPLQAAEIHQLLPEASLQDKYEEYLLRQLLVAEPGIRWCPAPDCSYAVIASGCAECPRLVCGRQDCGTEFCYHCRQPWHPNSSCEQAWRARGAPVLSLQKQVAGHDRDAIKFCPRCGICIMKIDDGSCNRMSCAVCGCLFCWLCLQEITDVHFLSPSGCTFWGKKPWSRTQRLLWQVGMVLGAPMVIALAAGIAVPVITLGIPIYMGKKVLSQGRKNKLSACQQCLSVASSSLLSLCLSPVITALAVGVAVPLMLTYVYGAVALSLCRNHWGGGGTRKKAEEHSLVELENLAKLHEKLAALEGGSFTTAMTTASLPSGSHSQHHEPRQKDYHSPSASVEALTAGSTFSEAQDISYRDRLRFVVHVEIEAEPEPSLCSAAAVSSPSPSPSPSSYSCSTVSLACPSDSCSLAGVE